MSITTNFLNEEMDVNFGVDNLPEPTSTDSNIAATFDSGEKNKKSPFKRYYVRVLTNDTDISIKKNKPKPFQNKQYKDYLDKLEDYNTQKKKDTLKTFFSFKHLNYLPSPYKAMADKLETYFTDTFQSD